MTPDPWGDDDRNRLWRGMVIGFALAWPFWFAVFLFLRWLWKES